MRCCGHRQARKGLRDMDWRDLAACRGEDPERWFPVGDGGPAATQTEEAKAVCRGCLVAGDCLRWAMSHPNTQGIWGGLTEKERRAESRRSTRVTAGGSK